MYCGDYEASIKLAGELSWQNRFLGMASAYRRTKSLPCSLIFRMMLACARGEFADIPTVHHGFTFPLEGAGESLDPPTIKS
jgi:hypothetical protein